LQDVLDKWPDKPVYVVSEELAEQVTGFHVHRGALASYKRRAAVPLGRPLHDATYGGSRSSTTSWTTPTSAPASALRRDGRRARCSSRRPAPTPLYRRSIKVSMGTVFQVPWTRLETWPGDLECSRTARYVAAAFALTDDSITLDDLVARRDDRLALIFGTEGHGLKPHVLEKADLTVRIPMAGGVDSLNVASSAAVAFYATRP
jgi:tRNA G18 (ribose-2'-O)-methylase SpoU